MWKWVFAIVGVLVVLSMLSFIVAAVKFVLIGVLVVAAITAVGYVRTEIIGKRRSRRIAR